MIYYLPYLIFYLFNIILIIGQSKQIALKSSDKHKIRYRSFSRPYIGSRPHAGPNSHRLFVLC